jgi:hypothetical protein
LTLYKECILTNANTVQVSELFSGTVVGSGQKWLRMTVRWTFSCHDVMYFCM